MSHNHCASRFQYTFYDAMHNLNKVVIKNTARLIHRSEMTEKQQIRRSLFFWPIFQLITHSQIIFILIVFQKNIMRKPRDELTTALKLRTTLYQLKNSSIKPQPQPFHPKPLLESSPVGITLLSLQPYRSKRKEGKSNRDNIENELKTQIFKKIRETMQSRLNYNGLEIAKVTMHCSKSRQNATERSQRETKGMKNRWQIKIDKNRCLRAKTQNSSTYRPYESTSQYYHPYQHLHPHQRLHKPITSQRKLRTQKGNMQQHEDGLQGWNYSTEEEDFCGVRASKGW